MVGLGQAWLHMMAQVAWRTPLVRATRWQRTHPTAHLQARDDGGCRRLCGGDEFQVALHGPETGGGCGCCA